MPLEDVTPRLDGYIRSALRRQDNQRRDNQRRDRARPIRDIRSILARMEADDPGLICRIEGLLVAEAFSATNEQQILAMAINTVTSQPRQHPREKSLGDSDFPGGDNPADVVDRSEREALLTSALRRGMGTLPAKQRLAIVEVYLNRKKQVEVCRETGVAAATLNDDLRKGLAGLAERMGHFRELYSQGC